MKRSEKPLRYEIHALERMQDRGVSRDQVAKTVHHPSTNRAARRKGTKRLERQLSPRKRLAVIAEEEKDFIRIVSVFWV